MEGFLIAVQVPRLNCAKRIVGGFSCALERSLPVCGGQAVVGDAYLA